KDTKPDTLYDTKRQSFFSAVVSADLKGVGGRYFLREAPKFVARAAPHVGFRRFLHFWPDPLVSGSEFAQADSNRQKPGENRPPSAAPPRTRRICACCAAIPANGRCVTAPPSRRAVRRAPSRRASSAPRRPMSGGASPPSCTGSAY